MRVEEGEEEEEEEGQRRDMSDALQGLRQKRARSEVERMATQAAATQPMELPMAGAQLSVGDAAPAPEQPMEIEQTVVVGDDLVLDADDFSPPAHVDRLPPRGAPLRVRRPPHGAPPREPQPLLLPHVPPWPLSAAPHRSQPALLRAERRRTC